MPSAFLENTCMSGHPLFLLALLTFILVVAFAAWSLMSTRRRHKYGENVPGVGGQNDPLS
jgi:hypothetical protein